jgi:methionine-rich copper-binding protein CopC
MRILTLATTALLALTTAGFAHAHAFLDHAEPRVGSKVAAAPTEVVLFFNQNLEAAFSSIEVSDANGARVDQGKPRINAGTMRVGVKPLPSGTYKVRWQVLSKDTHTTEGNFSFTVGP